MDTLGYRLRKLRETKGMTQSQLAKNADMSRSSIGMIENNERLPSIETINKLSNVLNCGIDYLINGDENEPDIMMIEKFDSITNDFQRKFVKAILNTSEEDLEVLERFFNKIKDG